MPIAATEPTPANDAAPAQLARTPDLVSLWRYWRRKLGARTVLPRAEIAPYEIPTLLPILTLTERMPDGRLRYRLAGSKVVEAYGFEATGKFLDELLTPERLKVAHFHVETALTSARPVFSQTLYLSPAGLHLVNARLNIPLADANGAVTMVLAGHVIEWRHALDAQFGDKGLVPENDTLEVL
jgi:hypothetical protein